MQRRFDRVIIAGAGPVGAVTGLLLAQAGVPVVLLEREHGAVKDYRASTFHPPTLDMLEASGVTQALVDMGLIAPVMQMRDRVAGKIAEFDFSVLRGETGHPYRLQCEQFKLVEWVYRKFSEIPGVELLFGHKVVSAAQSDLGVSVEAETADGIRRIEGDMLIACDGGSSTIRKLAGIDFDGFTYPEHFLVAGTRFDFRKQMPDLCSVNYTADPEEWFLLLQIPDMWRIVLPVREGVSATDAVSEQSIQSSLQNICPREEEYEVIVKAIYRVHQRVARTYRAGRIFLAGDAAHLNNPLGGMGLNGGLHDAISLTRRIAAVWHGRAGEAELDGYEPQRRPEAIHAINAITARNKRLLEERDEEVRKQNQLELKRVAADPVLSYNYMRDAAMISSLKRSGMLEQ